MRSSPPATPWRGGSRRPAKAATAEHALDDPGASSVGLVGGSTVIEWIGSASAAGTRYSSRRRCAGHYGCCACLLLGSSSAPARRRCSWRVSLSSVSNEQAVGTSGRTAKDVRRSLVVAQVASVFVLRLMACTSEFQRLAGATWFVPEDVTGRAAPAKTRHPDDAALRSVRGAGAGAGPCAARRRVGGAAAAYCSFSLQMQQQRHHPRRPGLRRRLNQSSPPDQLYASLGHLEALKARCLNAGCFRRTATTSDAPRGCHRRRTAGQALLAQPGSGGPTHATCPTRRDAQRLPARP